MAKTKSHTRRNLVGLGLRLPFYGAFGGLISACSGQSGPPCADPDDWSMSEAGLRKVNNYTESSPHADKSCTNCAFFKADPSPELPSCGQCDIFVSFAHKDGYCDSWSIIES
jgi:hypothetical protein